MRQVVVTRHGPPDVLRMRDVPAPTPARGEIRIAVAAAGVNFSDILARVGLYPDAPRPPCVVGYEVAGYVDAVGEDVRRTAVGDRVMALTDFGGYAESVVVPEAQAFPAPARLSNEEAAGVPVVYATALLALYRMAAIEPGETVLVHGAAGGVGIAATQLARLRGAIVIGTASAAKHEAVRAFGAAHVIDYRTEDVVSRVRQITGGRGVDVVLDPLGGRSLRDSYRLLAPLGRLIIYGMSAAIPGERRRLWQVARTFLEMPAFRPLRLLHDNRAVFGLHLGRLWGELPKLTPLMLALLADIEAGRIQPAAVTTLPLERAADAHRLLHERRNIGKVVLTTPLAAR